MPLGVDATISEGWLDLKVKNETADTFQLRLSFDPEHLTGRLLSSAEPEAVYRVVNGAVTYWRRDGAVYEEAEVVPGKISRQGETRRRNPSCCTATCAASVIRCPKASPSSRRRKEPGYEQKSHRGPLWRLLT